MRWVLRMWKSHPNRGREGGGREKRFSVEIVWTAVPPDDRRGLKGTLTRKERIESQNDRIRCLDWIIDRCPPRRVGGPSYIHERLVSATLEVAI